MVTILYHLAKLLIIYLHTIINFKCTTRHTTERQLSQLTILWHSSGIQFKGIILTLYLMRFL